MSNKLQALDSLRRAKNNLERLEKEARLRAVGKYGPNPAAQRALDEQRREREEQQDKRLAFRRAILRFYQQRPSPLLGDVFTLTEARCEGCGTLLRVGAGWEYKKDVDIVYCWGCLVGDYPGGGGALDSRTPCLQICPASCGCQPKHAPVKPLPEPAWTLAFNPVFSLE